MEATSYFGSSASWKEVGAAWHDWELSWCDKAPKESCERLDEAVNLLEDQDKRLHH
jgi:hypothetical protein